MRSLFCLFSFSCAQEQQHAEQRRQEDVFVLLDALQRLLHGRCVHFGSIQS